MGSPSPSFDVRELEYQYRRFGKGSPFDKQFSDQVEKFVCSGLGLSTPVDMMPPGKYPILKNVRVYAIGEIDCRPGQLALGGGALDQLSVHSLKRLNDETHQLLTRIVGAGVSLYAGVVPVNPAIDTGYSGNPLSFVPYRPDQSPEPWMYIGDSSRMRKVRRDGTNYPMGIAPPNIAPTVAFAAPIVSIIEDFEAVGAWAPGGSAGAIALFNRVNTTIQRILFDAGNTGWASIVPVAMDNLELSAIVNVNAAGLTNEKDTIFGVYKAVVSTTLESITYDAGVNGLCTVQPVAMSASVRKNTTVASRLSALSDDLAGDYLTPYDPVAKKHIPRRVFVDRPATQADTTWLTALGIAPDAVVLLNAGKANEEAVRILSVSVGKDGKASFRCSTAQTHAALETLDGLRSFRAFTTNNHAPLETLTSKGFQTTIATGLGWVQIVSPFNLGMVGARATQDSDEIHISLKLDNIANLVEGRVIFDVDPATNDFAHNCFIHDFRPNDLVAGLKNSTTMLNARQRALQNRYVDNVQTDYRSRVTGGVANKANRLSDGDFIDLETRGRGVGSNKQTPTGDSQWFDLHFKVSELNRVGTDKSRGLADVAGIRIQLQVSAATVFQIDSLWVGGTYGPDVSEIGDPYLVRYRYRSSLTGAKSNPSPPIRSGISPHRQRLSYVATPSADAQVDRLDWYRWGGLLPAWFYVGSADNNGNPFFDDIQDQDIVFNDLLEFDNFQPFPSVDTPKSGVCNVIGTVVNRVSGDPFATNWAPGTVINLNGVNQVVYAQPTSANRLEIQDNASTLNNVKWFVNEPVLLGQPVPVIVGPMSNFVFGIGDPNRPGALLFCKGNNPDSAPEVNFLEITSPTDPLMNGGMVDGRLVVLSTQKAFGVYPAFDQTSEFTFTELAVDRGLLARWFFCIHDGVMYIGDKDGIYASRGGPGETITADIYRLFPHDGQPGEAVNGFTPPDMTRASDLRLSGYDQQIYFDYVDTNGNRRTMMYDVNLKGWFPDVYGQPVVTHYGEEGKGVHGILMGATNGKVYQFGGKTDDGAAIVCQVRTPGRDGGDQRANKLWGDILLDLNPNALASGILVTPFFDNFDFNLATQALINGDVDRNHYVLDILGGNGKLARNMALDLQWQDTVGVKLFQWQLSYIGKPEDTLLRFTDWDDLGYSGAKFIQGVVIEADTSNLARVVDVQYDGGTVGATLQVKHNGQIEVPYSFPPFVAHSVRLAPSDANSWRLHRSRFVWEPAPELAVNWTTQGTTHDLKGYQWVRDALLAMESTADVTLTITVDGADYVYVIPHTAGAYRKVYLPFKAVKGKLFVYKLTSAAGFRLYERDCEVRVRSWADPGPYRPVNPFGDIHRVYGARI